MADCVAVTVDVVGESNGRTDVLQIPTDISWQDLELLLKLTFECEDICVKYMDEDNDKICLNSQIELQEAFKDAIQQDNTMRMLLKRVKCTPVNVTSENNHTTTSDIGGDCQPNNLVTDGEGANDKPSYIVPTTENGDDSATIIVENLEDLKEPEKTDVEVLEMESELATNEEIGSSHSACATAITSNVQRASRKSPRLYFQLRNCKNKLVLDVEGWGLLPGTPVKLYEAKYPPQHCENQVFYENREQGTICCLFNGMCIDANNTGVTISKYETDRMSQQWEVCGGRIQNKANAGLVIGLKEQNFPVKTELLCAQTHHGFKGQHWIVEFVDIDALGKQEKVAMEIDSAFISGSGARPKQAKKLEKKLRKHYYSYLSHEFSRLQAKEMHRTRTDKPAGYYTGLAAICDDWEIQNNEVAVKEEVPDVNTLITPNDEVVCLESGEKSRVKSSEESEPPVWFYTWMEKFKKDIAKDISQTVARRTVRQVIGALEGTVIAPTYEESTQTRAFDESDSYEKVPCHDCVLCDHCDSTIVGIRYKCGNCKDFDLCEDCEVLENVHDPEHVFLKIKRPTETAGVKMSGKRVPLLKRSIYVPKEDLNKRRDRRIAKETEKLEGKESRKEVKKERYEEKKAKKTADRLAKIAAKLERHEGKYCKKREEHCNKVKESEEEENEGKKKKVPTATLR